MTTSLADFRLTVSVVMTEGPISERDLRPNWARGEVDILCSIGSEVEDMGGRVDFHGDVGKVAVARAEAVEEVGADGSPSAVEEGLPLLTLIVILFFLGASFSAVFMLYVASFRLSSKIVAFDGRSGSSYFVGKVKSFGNDLLIFRSKLLSSQLLVNRNFSRTPLFRLRYSNY